MRALRFFLLGCLSVWQCSTALLGGEFRLTNEDVVRGEPVTFDDVGMVVRLDIGGYSQRISWSKLTQDSLQELAKNPQAAKFALRAGLQVLERVGIEEGGVRVEAGQHAADGFVDQFLVVDRFDVVRLHRAEDVGERADLLERYGTPRIAERIGRDPEGYEDAGDCAYAD